MIPKSVCPLWHADIPSDPCRKARPSAVSYTTPVDTINPPRWFAILSYDASSMPSSETRICSFTSAGFADAARSNASTLSAKR